MRRVAVHLPRAGRDAGGDCVPPWTASAASRTGAAWARARIRSGLMRSENHAPRQSGAELGAWVTALSETSPRKTCGNRLHSSCYGRTSVSASRAAGSRPVGLRRHLPNEGGLPALPTLVPSSGCRRRTFKNSGCAISILGFAPATDYGRSQNPVPIEGPTEPGVRRLEWTRESGSRSRSPVGKRAQARVGSIPDSLADGLDGCARANRRARWGFGRAS